MNHDTAGQDPGSEDIGGADTAHGDTPLEGAEVIVIGAGFAGLAAAQVLGRAQRQVLVLGAGPTRNAEASHAHNVLTRDGTPPDELLDLAMAEVERLATVRVESAWVTTVEPLPDGSAPVEGAAGPGMQVRLADGRAVSAAHVVLATGARDKLPDVPGLLQLWGRRVHSCPFCDGEDYAGRRVLVLADDPATAHLAGILAGWTDQLTVLASGAVVSLAEGGDGGVVAITAGGDRVEVDGVFVQATPLVRLDAVADLALARRGPFLAVDGDGRTSNPRLWAAGDCAWVDGQLFPGGQVIAAMADGARAGAAITLDLLGVHRLDLPPVDLPRTAERSGSGRPLGHGHDHGERDGEADHGHGSSGEQSEAPSLAEFWEGHYGQRERVWSGKPNVGLVASVTDVTQGTALDLGCGEGADAIWLAERGWTVIGVDVSPTALTRGQAAAEEAGVGEHITWAHTDLGQRFPDGEFDLVVAAYLLSPVEIPRDQILQQAAGAVAPGGRLVVLSHARPYWATPDLIAMFPTLDEQLASLALGDEWSVDRTDTFDRRMRAPDGTVGSHSDTLLVARRLG